MPVASIVDPAAEIEQWSILWYDHVENECWDQKFRASKLKNSVAAPRWMRPTQRPISASIQFVDKNELLIEMRNISIMWFNQFGKIIQWDARREGGGCRSQDGGRDAFATWMFFEGGKQRNVAGFVNQLPIKSTIETFELKSKVQISVGMEPVIFDSIRWIIGWSNLASNQARFDINLKRFSFSLFSFFFYFVGVVVLFTPMVITNPNPFVLFIWRHRSSFHCCYRE